MKNIITLFALFLLFLQAIPAQNTQKEQYFGVFNLTDFSILPDGGCLVTGISTNDTIEIMRYDSNLNLLFKSAVSIRDSIDYYQFVYDASAVTLSDGTIVVAVGVFECDIWLYRHVFALSADGQNLLWHKTNLECRQIFKGDDNTFYAGGQHENYDANGELIAGNSFYNLPNLRLQLDSTNWLNANGTIVFRSDFRANLLGTLWQAPETIQQLDTLAGGGFAVFSEGTVYYLTPDLNLSGSIDIPNVYKNVPLKTCPLGFVALLSSGTHSLLHTLGPDFSVIATYDLGEKLMPVYRNSTFSILSNMLTVKQKEFTLILHHTAPVSMLQQAWVLRDTLGLAGTWSSPLDLRIVNISFDDTPYGSKVSLGYPPPPNTQFKYYANFGHFRVQVKNQGQDTVQYCKLGYTPGNYCGEFPGCPLGPIRFSKSFDSLHLAPGATALLDFGDFGGVCSYYDLRNFCVNVTEINHHRDNTSDNNLFCKNVPNLYVSSREAPDFQFRLSPNPVSDFLHLEVPEDIHPERYQIFAADGRMVQEGVFLTEMPVENLAKGLFLLVLTDDAGKYGTVRFIRI